MTPPRWHTMEVGMVIVRLMGGLGNQMFQYATGRAVALRLETELILDKTWFATKGPDPWRGYELNRFRVEEREMTGWEWTWLRPRGAGEPRGIWPARMLRGLARRTFVSVRRPEHAGVFDPKVFAPARRIYLDGYWQSERYFAADEDVIREEFQWREEPDADNGALLEQIRRWKGEAVAMHVRRGDYVSDAKTNAFHGVCGIDYYERAVAEIQSRVRKPQFFVFSDDPAWVRENLRVEGSGGATVYVTHNVGKRNAEDLRLMAACRHFVIANSSFSWWGAWLGEHPEKVVVAPRKWFARAEEQMDDLLPAAWVRV